MHKIIISSAGAASLASFETPDEEPRPRRRMHAHFACTLCLPVLSKGVQKNGRERARDAFIFMFS